MSLRDQLVAKGLASKKDKARVQRDLKTSRKKKSGERRRKSVVEREEREAAQAAAEAAVREKALARKARQDERDAFELIFRVRQTVSDNQVRSRGTVVFHFKKLDGRRLGRLKTSEGVARQLRSGEAGIAALPPPATRAAAEEEYVIIGLKAVRKLQEIAPAYLVFYVDDTAGISSPEEAFLEQDWDISLTPRRLTEG